MGVIGMTEPLWSPAVGEFLGRVTVEAEELEVFARVPWETVDPVEAEDVVEAEHAKDFREPGEAFAPPCEAGFRHGVPVVERYAPVLPPLVDEGIFGGVTFGRGAAEPVRVEAGAVEKNVRGVEGDADGEIAHEFHAAAVGVGAEIEPLAVAEPLRVGEGFEAGNDVGGIFRAQRCDELMGTIYRLRFHGPLVPC